MEFESVEVTIVKLVVWFFFPMPTQDKECQVDILELLLLGGQKKMDDFDHHFCWPCPAEETLKKGNKSLKVTINLQFAHDILKEVWSFFTNCDELGFNLFQIFRTIKKEVSDKNE